MSNPASFSAMKGSPVPEDTLHEIQVGYAARGLRRTLPLGTFPVCSLPPRGIPRAAKSENPALGWVLFLRGKGKDHILCRRVEGNPEQFLGRVKRNDLLVVGGGKAYVGYVEDPGSCSAVPRRVVEDPCATLLESMMSELKCLPSLGREQIRSQAMAVEDEGLGRQAGPVVPRIRLRNCWIRSSAGQRCPFSRRTFSRYSLIRDLPSLMAGLADWSPTTGRPRVASLRLA